MNVLTHPASCVQMHFRLAVLLLGFVLILVSNSDALGQQGTLGLKHIVYANTSKTEKRPERGWADEHGGEFFVTIVHTEKFAETVHVSWEFDKSVANLSAGEEFQMTLTIEISKPGSAGNDPKRYSSISNYFVQGSNFTNGSPTAGLDRLKRDKVRSQQLISGPVSTHEKIKHLIVYARADGSTAGDNHYGKNNHVRRATGVYSVAETIRAGGADGFYFRFATYPGLGSSDDGRRRNCNCEIAYIYESGAKSDLPILTLGDGKPPKRDSKRDTNDDLTKDQPGDDTPRNLPPRSPWGKEILPPWFPPIAGNTPPDGPTTRYRPKDWSVYETDWPPVIIGKARGRNPTTFGTPDDWWNPGLPTAFPPNSTNGGARILLAGRRRVAIGKEVTIPVYLFFPRGTAALNFEVEYDSSVVTPAEDPDRGPVFAQSVRFSGESREAGRLRIGFAQSQPLSRSGIVANLRFRAVGSPGDRADLHLGVYDLKDSNRRPLAMDLYDGQVEIVSKYRPGDSDGDDVLTVFDAQRAIDMSTRKIDEDLALDMDGSGNVLATDSLIILQRIDVRQSRFGSR